MLIWPILLATQFVLQTADLPSRQPQLAVSGSRLAIAYGAGNSVFCVTSADGGKNWSKPVLVSSKGRLALGSRRGPRIAATPKAIIVSAVVGEKGGGADGDLIAWRSLDGGRTWSSGTRVNDVPAAAREGLHAMAADGKGTLFAVWLDLRIKGTRLYGSSSTDGGLTWSQNSLVYQSPSGSVCECCHPTAAFDEQGRVFVLFRNSMDGNRDMYLIRSGDRGRTFGPAEKLGTGTWKLAACPMDGGSLQIGADGRPVSIWRRGDNVFTSTGPNTEQQLGAGRQPVLAITSRGPVFAWIEGRALKIKVPDQTPATLDEDAAYPSIVSLQGGTAVLAWERGGTIVVEAVD